MERPIRISIVTPVYIGEDWDKQRRLECFEKCIESIRNQTYDKEKIEHVIVNDGSTVALSIPAYPWIKVVDQENLQRLTAYNRGFQSARGEIFWCLDSDDEIKEDGCEVVDNYFRQNPKYNIFNFGCTFTHQDGGASKRGVFKPKRKKKGHQIFGGGTIVNGTFTFKREVWEDLGGFPDHHITNINCSDINYGGERELWMTSPYDFSAYAQIEFPEIRKYFMVDHVAEPNKIIKELGNPGGNDYYLFYKYTRKYHSNPMDDYLLNVNLK